MRQHEENAHAIVDLLDGREERFLLYCDDLSFEANDASYKSLKAILDGSVAAAPDMDIQAWGFEGSAGYTWDVTGNPDLHVGLTYASGDDDPADNDWETFAAPMPDPHPRLGFADLDGISVTAPTERVREAMGRLDRFMRSTSQ